jgi:hypothetical protein
MAGSVCRTGMMVLSQQESGVMADDGASLPGERPHAMRLSVA